MGKGTPKPPDPKKTAAAQTATNVSTALANQFLGNVNQVTPDGTLTFSYSGLGGPGQGGASGPQPNAPADGTQGGGGTQPDAGSGGFNYDPSQYTNSYVGQEGGPGVSTGGAPQPAQPQQNQQPPAGAQPMQGGGFQVTDPTSGATYNIPQTTVTQTLSPEQQAIKDQNDQASLGLSQLANSQIGRLGGIMSQPFSYDNAPITGLNTSLDGQAFVKDLYQQGLGRDPNQEGLEFWTNQLDNGMSKSELIRQFQLSDERDGGPSLPNAGTADMLAAADQDYQQFGGGPNLQTGVQGAGQGLATSVPGAGQGYQTGVQGAGEGLVRGVDGAGQGLARSIEGAGQGIARGPLAGAGEGLATGISGIGQGLQFGGGGAGGNFVSSVDGVGEGIRGNVASAGQRQTDLATGDNPALRSTIDDAGQITRSIEDAGQITGMIDDAGQIQRGYRPDGGFSEDRRRVEEALLSRLRPELNRSFDRERSLLANQGITRGSEAYDRAMESLREQENDARFGAILRGGQEQSRLMNLVRGEAQFQNAAQAQAYGQNANDAQFANQAQAQQYGQNARDAGFANQAQGQAFGQNVTGAQFQNAANQQAFGQDLQAGQFANQAMGQQFSENLARGQFANAAQGQGVQQGLAQGQLANQAAQAQGSLANQSARIANQAAAELARQKLANAQLQNAAQGQGFRQQAMSRDAQNQAQSQAFGQNATDAQLQNQAQQTAFGQALGAGQFTNAAQGQAVDQRLANAGLNNQATAQGFQDQLAAGQFQNAAQGQAFGQNLAAGQFGNQAAQSMFDNQFRATAGNNQLNDANFSRQQALFNAMNTERDRAIAERTNQRNQPINEIAALLSGSQVQAPNFIPTQSAQIPTVDYAGLVNQNYQQRLANSQRQSGLFGNLIGAAGKIGAAAIS